jgi:hypothetical protein
MVSRPNIIMMIDRARRLADRHIILLATAKVRTWLSALALMVGLAMAVLAVIAVPGVRESAAPDTADMQGTVSAPRSPIQHVIFLLKENHTFDNYFGAFPAVNGPLPPGTPGCPPPARRVRPGASSGYCGYHEAGGMRVLKSLTWMSDTPAVWIASRKQATASPTSR